MTINLGTLQGQSGGADPKWFDVTLGHNHDGINSRKMLDYIEAISTVELSQASPNTNFYNLGSFYLDITAGDWLVGFYVDCGIGTNAICRDIIQVALSTSNSSASDNALVDDWSCQVAVANDQSIKGFSRIHKISLAQTTRYYLISRQTGPTGGATCTYMWWEGQVATTKIWALKLN